jgi:hypothetical protein
MLIPISAHSHAFHIGVLMKLEEILIDMPHNFLYIG